MRDSYRQAECGTVVRISWLDSCGMPSRIHLTQGGLDTVCGGHSEYLTNRTLAQSPQKRYGCSNYCRVCFKNGGKSAPWDSRCTDNSTTEKP